MTIKESVSFSDIKRSEFNRLANEYMANFENSVKNNPLNPLEIIRIYKESLADLAEQLFFNFGMKLYIGQLKGFSIERDVLNRGRNLVKFSDKGFEKAYLSEISILLLQYKENVLEGQIILAAFKLLFSNFNIINVNILNNKYSFESYLYNIKQYIENILNMDIAELPSINGKEPEFKINIPETTFDLSKPSKPEHLTGLWIDGMTRAERKKAVMNYYLCSKNTAIKWMRMFNLWDEPEYVDYKAKYEEALKEIEELKQCLAMKEEVINNLI